MSNINIRECEPDGYNTKLIRLTYDVQGELGIHEIYMDQDYKLINPDQDIPEEIKQYIDDKIIQKQVSDPNNVLHKARPIGTPFKDRFGIVSLVLYYIYIFAIALAPFNIVVGKFIPSFWISTVVFLVYYWLSGVFVVTFGFIQIGIALIGYYFAFVDFPLWFFIFYCVLMTPRLLFVFYIATRKER